MRLVQPNVKIILVLCFILPFFFLAPPVHADGGAPDLAYVAGAANGVGIIDIIKQQAAGTLNIAGNPSMILLSVDGRLLYVAQPALQRVEVIATATKSTLCTAPYPGHPTLLTLDPGTNTLYAAASDTNVVEALDPMTCAIQHKVMTSGPVTGMAVAVVGSGILGGNGNQLWVASKPGIGIFDSSGKQLANVPMQDEPTYLCIPPGSTAYVTTEQGTIDAVDLHSHQVLPQLLTRGSFGPMDYDAATGQVYVPDRQHHVVDVLSPIGSVTATAPHEPIRVIPVSAAPQSIAITSDGQFGFIAVQDGTVVMLDLPGRNVVKIFHVGGQPRFIITGLYPSLLSLTPQQASVVSILENLSHYAAAVVVVLAAVIAILINRRKITRS
ncbi:MAG TPA: YncE family protein [Ktedonobacteraceae bacterium]